MKKEHLKTVFKANAKAKDLHVTSDGHIFYDKSDAENAARHLADKTVVTHDRAVIMSEPLLDETESELAKEQERIAQSDLKEQARVKSDLDESLEGFVAEKDQVLQDETKSAQEVAEAKEKLAETSPKELGQKTPAKPAPVLKKAAPAKKAAPDKKPAETKTDEKPAETKTDEKPAETKTEEKSTETNTEEKPAETKTAA